MQAKRAQLQIVDGQRGGHPQLRNLEELADSDLMLVAAEGVHAAFEVLVRRYQPMVLGFATRFLGDRELAREVAQDVFLALWSERSRFRAGAKFKSYLFTRTCNRCQFVNRTRRNHLKKLITFERCVRAQTPQAHTALDGLLTASRARELHWKLAKLPAAHRQTLMLRYFVGLSLEEIATTTKKPIGTVKSNVFRGLKSLHTQITTETM